MYVKYIRNAVAICHLGHNSGASSWALNVYDVRDRHFNLPLWYGICQEDFTELPRKGNEESPNRPGSLSPCHLT
jgi:hypothetical protein